MDLKTLRDRFYLRIGTVEKSREACLVEGDRHHEIARHSKGEKAKQEREQAEEFHAAAKDLRDSLGQRTAEPVNNGVQITASGSAGANAAIHEGNTKLLPWLIFNAMLSGFSLAVAIFVMVQFAQMQNNMARMGVHIMSNDALLLREGIMQPGDQWAGPEGNIEYGRKDQPKQRR